MSHSHSERSDTIPILSFAFMQLNLSQTTTEKAADDLMKQELKMPPKNVTFRFVK